MNNDDKKSSNQMNTTPFNNHNKKTEELNIPKNNQPTSNRPNNQSLSIPNTGGTGLNSKRRNNITNNNKNKSNIDSRSNSKPSGLGSTANNLRNKLNTVPRNKEQAKNELAKKGADALKKSANPYAKAAGYAMSLANKRREKKQQEKNDDDKNEETKNEEVDNQDNEEKNNGLISESREASVIKKILPLLGIIAGFIILLLLLLSILSPVISAYSWFVSIFHHKNDDSTVYTIYNEKDSENYKAEQAYNDAIVGSKDGRVVGIVATYQEKYGVTIDWYLLNALITYRFTENGSENVYSGDGNQDLSEEELNERIEELDKREDGETTEASSDSGIDYTEAKKKIESFASLMVVKENGGYVTDIDKNGKVYNQIIESSTFKSYYKSLLKDESLETRKDLLDKIYDYAETGREIVKEEEPAAGGVVGDTSIVHVQTCKQSYSYKTINNLRVYDNPPWNEGTDYPDYLNMKDYIKGLVYREIGVSNSYIEAMKAQAIAGLTFLIQDSESGFDLKSGEMYFPGGTCRQATCSPTYGCTSFHEPTSSHSGISTTLIGKRSGNYHAPISEKYDAILEEVLNEVFGKILVKKGVTSTSFSGSSDAIKTSYLDKCNPGRCFSQQNAMTDARNGMNYVQILQKYYSSYSYDIIDIKEGLYFESTEDYSGPVNLNENYHYYQSDSRWGGLTLCDSGDISANGCNITSAAMAISLLKNQQITPATLHSRQREINSCTSGTRPQMIMNFAKLYGLKTSTIDKKNTSAVNDMLKKLSTGNYVAIVRLASSTSRSVRYYTRNGHYMTAVSVKTENGKNKILIWDPAGKNNSKRDNYWADMETDIMPYLQNGISFILIGK